MARMPNYQWSASGNAFKQTGRKKGPKRKKFDRFPFKSSGDHHPHCEWPKWWDNPNKDGDKKPLRLSTYSW